LRALDCFDQTTITAEDRARTRMYVEDRERKSSASTATSMAEWLAGLDVVIDVVPLDAASMKRTVQLINKTNQMNLTGHRTSEAELTAWLAAEPHRQAFSVSVGDRFGHLGLTGAFTLQRKGDALEVVDFVLSCRAMGRKVEDTLAHFWVEQARAAGAARVIAQAVPTAKNMPCLAFLRQADFTEAAANLFERDTTRPYGIVKGITLNTQAAQADDETAPC
jgi:FkbH-like protein